jgi:hypothetical protein
MIKDVRTRSYFGTELLFIYSLLIAGIDSLVSSSSDTQSFSFETYCMRALSVFSFWLIVKTLSGKVAKKGYSYRISAILISIGLILVLVIFAPLIVIL